MSTTDHQHDGEVQPGNRVMLTAPKAQGLYDPQFEHDACGVGFIAHVKGKKSHATPSPLS
jgi:hypothetical protein